MWVSRSLEVLSTEIRRSYGIGVDEFNFVCVKF